MPVNWWVLTKYQYPRFLISQLSPFGIRFTNCILYRADIDQIIIKKKPPLSDLTVQILGPDDWETAKALGLKHGLRLSNCNQSQVALALQDGIPVGHFCLQSGAFYVDETEREESFDDGIYLFNMFIAPSARRRGIGKFLVMTALEMADGWEDRQYAYVYVREENTASRHLVKSLGFAEVQIVHHLRVLGSSSYQTEHLNNPSKSNDDHPIPVGESAKNG